MIGPMPGPAAIRRVRMERYKELMRDLEKRRLNSSTAQPTSEVQLE